MPWWWRSVANSNFFEELFSCSSYCCFSYLTYMYMLQANLQVSRITALLVAKEATFILLCFYYKIPDFCSGVFQWGHCQNPPKPISIWAESEWNPNPVKNRGPGLEVRIEGLQLWWAQLKLFFNFFVFLRVEQPRQTFKLNQLTEVLTANPYGLKWAIWAYY